MPRISVYFLTIESAVIVLFFGFVAGVWSRLWKWRWEYLVKMDQGTVSRIKIEFGLLLAVLLCRIMLNIVFRISNFNDPLPDDMCYVDS